MPSSGPSWSNSGLIGRFRAKCDRAWSTSSRKFGRSRLSSGGRFQICPALVELGPNLADSGPNSVGAGPSLEAPPKRFLELLRWFKFCPTPVDLCPILAHSQSTWPMLVESVPHSGPELKISTNFGRFRKFRCFWDLLTLVASCPTSAHSVQIWTILGQLGHCWPKQSKSRPAFDKCRHDQTPATRPQRGATINLFPVAYPKTPPGSLDTEPEVLGGGSPEIWPEATS